MTKEEKTEKLKVQKNGTRLKRKMQKKAFHDKKS